MFSLFGKLFSISIKEIPSKLWHKDVKLYQIDDRSAENQGSLIGYFMMDLFPRDGKYGHAMMTDVITPHEKT